MKTLPAITAEIMESLKEKFPNGLGTLHELEGEIPPKFEDLSVEVGTFLRAALRKVAEETYEATKIEPVGACSIGMCGHKNVDANSANHGVYIGTKAAADEQEQNFKTFINQ